jgi:hypothetical protein
MAIVATWDLSSCIDGYLELSSLETGNTRPQKRECNADDKKGGPSTRQATRLAEGENPVASPIPLLQTSQPMPGSLDEPLVAFLCVIPLTVENPGSRATWYYPQARCVYASIICLPP